MRLNYEEKKRDLDYLIKRSETLQQELCELYSVTRSMRQDNNLIDIYIIKLLDKAIININSSLYHLGISKNSEQ